MKYIISFFFRQGPLVHLITLLILLGGIWSALSLKKDVFPTVDFDYISVSTLYPGASPEVVEKSITNLLEKDLLEMEGIENMTSSSIENQSHIYLKIDPSEIDIDDALTDVREIVNGFKDLPKDADSPVITRMTNKSEPLLEILISSSKVTRITLHDEVKRLERILRPVPGVAKINLIGFQDKEIHVKADPKKLKGLNVTIQEIISTISDLNKSIPGGSLEFNGGREDLIRTSGEFENIKDIEDSVVHANVLGKTIKVKDLATVSYALKKPREVYHLNGDVAVSLKILKKESADAIKTAKLVKQALSDAKISDDYNVSCVNDISQYVQRRVDVLLNNFSFGLLFLLLVLAISLPFRVAIITSLSIPFSFLGTLMVFDIYDISVNLISLMGLIIVVGMLVDDSIVVSENIQRRLENGQEPNEAAKEGSQEVWAPVFTSVLTTILAFFPLMLMSGVFGKFVKYIPIGVIVALLFSLFECFFILPYHMKAFMTVRHLSSQSSNIFVRFKSFLNEKIYRPIFQKYKDILKSVIKFRYVLFSAVIVFIVVTLFYAFSMMKFVLFSPVGIEIVRLDISAKPETSIDGTREKLKGVENIIMGLPKNEFKNMTSYIGMQLYSKGSKSLKIGSNLAQITIYLSPESERNRIAQSIIDDLKSQFKDINDLELIFTPLKAGPPVGPPIEIVIQGEELSEILNASRELQDMIKAIPGTQDISDSFYLGKNEISISLNESQAKASLISLSDVGSIVSSFFDGVIASKVRKVDESIGIRVMAEHNRTIKEDLRDMYVRNRLGEFIPLKNLVKVTKSASVTSYDHEDNQRKISVTADIDTDVNTSRDVNNFIREKIGKYKKQFPSLNFKFGGEEKDTQESLGSLFKAFIFAVFGIFTLLIMLFKNFYQPFIVLFTIPLGITSVIWVFLSHGEPLSFLSMVGLISLSGVIVNNAIILIDFINKLRKEGQLSIEESVIKSCSLRLRPIALTTITTVIGILPTAYGLGGLDPFIIPIALALGWGLFIGSIFTLFFLPALVTIAEDVRGFLALKFSNASKK